MSALVCGNDYEALHALRILCEGGLNVPEDISIVGCDDLEPARHSVPPLSTVQVDKRQMGRSAIQLLLARPERREHVCLPSQYVARGTTAKRA